MYPRSRINYSSTLMPTNNTTLQSDKHNKRNKMKLIHTVAPMGVIAVAVVSLIISTLFLSTVQSAQEPYKAFDPFPMPPERPVPTLTSAQQITLNTLLSLVNSQWQGCIVTSNATLLSQYAEDYGHTVHNVPNIVFQPKNSADVSLLVQKVYFLNRHRPASAPVPVRIVTRGAGGNVLGAAQVLNDQSVLSVLLDMSVLTSVQLLPQSRSVWAEPGTTFLQVLKQAETINMRPLVLPDYLGVTIGGVESIGGWGGDSAVRGPCVEHVKEIEVVTSTGQIVLCSPSKNRRLFNAVRGGMGQFGIMTRVRLNLEVNEPNTRVYHMISTSLDDLLGATKTVYRKLMTKRVRGQVLVNTMQTFVLRNQEDSIRSFALFGNQDILASEVNQLVAHPQYHVYMLELTTRFTSESEALSMEQLIQKLGGVQFDLVYALDMDTHSWDNRLELTSIPFLVMTQQWFKRHTWLNMFFTERDARRDLAPVLSNLTISDTGGGHIGLYPIRIDSVSKDTFVSIPNAGRVQRGEEWVYLLVLGRDESSDTEEGFLSQVNGNRIIWNQFSTVQDRRHRLVSSSVYPTNIVPNWGPSDWRAHFGDRKWRRFQTAKRSFDPKFVFADTRAFGF